MPSLVDGAPGEGLKDFLGKSSDRLIIADKLTPGIISTDLKNKDLDFEGVSGGILYHHRRLLSDGQVIFLINSDLSSDLTGKIKLTGSDAIEMNTLTGEIHGYPCIKEGEKITCVFSLPPAGSLLLFIPYQKTGDFPIPVVKTVLYPVASTSPMSITKDAENALMIDFCDITVGDETVKDLHTYYAADKVYKYYGFKNGNPWNTSVQFRTNIVDRDTFGLKTGFTAAYHFIVKGDFDYSSFKTVVERPDLWTVKVNDTVVKPDEGKWWIDTNFRVFNIGNLVKKGNNTITIKASPMKIHAEIEPVYLTGDFSVKPADKGWIIEAPVKTLTMGSWKEQGMPFYSWGVGYTKEFNIEKPEGQYFISLNNWKGTIAEIMVNDQPATPVAFPPYRSEITALIKPGPNKIEVKVIGSLKNLLGPHHNNPPAGLASPGNWRNVKSYPAGKDYQMLDYGLYDEFTLLQGK